MNWIKCSDCDFDVTERQMLNCNQFKELSGTGKCPFFFITCDKEYEALLECREISKAKTMDKLRPHKDFLFHETTFLAFKLKQACQAIDALNEKVETLFHEVDMLQMENKEMAEHIKHLYKFVGNMPSNVSDIITENGLISKDVILEKLKT